MARYRFTGLAPEIFPSIVLGDEDSGYHTLSCEPGDEIDLPEPVDHPRLESLDAAPAAPAEPEE